MSRCSSAKRVQVKSEQTIRILVDHVDAIAQAGLLSAFAFYDDFEVVHPQAAGVAVDIDVDVVATDFENALRLMSPNSPSAQSKVLIVTHNDRECDIRKAIKCGARGYLLQGCSLDELADAVRKASAGSIYVGAQVAQRLAESMYGEPLTYREEDVLRYAIEGLCNKEIAKQLNLAVGTVKSHLRSVYVKLKVTSRTHAAAVAERRGLIRYVGKHYHAIAQPSASTGSAHA